jgi:hypothetical protein
MLVGKTQATCISNTRAATYSFTPAYHASGTPRESDRYRYVTLQARHTVATIYGNRKADPSCAARVDQLPCKEAEFGVCYAPAILAIALVKHLKNTGKLPFFFTIDD